MPLGRDVRVKHAFKAASTPNFSLDLLDADAQQLYTLAYASVATKYFKDDELRTFLHSFRKNNMEKNISGMLVHSNSVFLQVVEGNKGELWKLCATIQKDERHQQFTMLWSQPIPERVFQSWSMGFQRLCLEDILQREQGFSPILQEQEPFDFFVANPSLTQNLLLSFRSDALGLSSPTGKPSLVSSVASMLRASAPPKPRECEVCGETEHLNLCSGCHEEIYCSVACQTQAWPVHARKCLASKKEPSKLS